MQFANHLRVEGVRQRSTRHTSEKEGIRSSFRHAVGLCLLAGILLGVVGCAHVPLSEEGMAASRPFRDTEKVWAETEEEKPRRPVPLSKASEFDASGVWEGEHLDPGIFVRREWRTHRQPNGQLSTRVMTYRENRLVEDRTPTGTWWQRNGTLFHRYQKPSAVIGYAVELIPNGMLLLSQLQNSLLFIERPVADADVQSEPARNQWRPELEEGDSALMRRFAGVWRGFHYDHDAGIRREWTQFRDEDGDYEVHFRIYRGDRLEATTEEFGYWWIEHGVYHEYGESWEGYPHTYLLTELTEGVLKFSHTDYSYVFVEWRIHDIESSSAHGTATFTGPERESTPP